MSSIPSGEKDSANNKAKRYVDNNDDSVVMETLGKPNAAINIIGVIEQHVSATKALEFAYDYIRLTGK